ncbi:MAG: sulfotransferase [Planctomycetota bacterium]|nr:sulfotransferase [Planctomycetota bacterium]
MWIIRDGRAFVASTLRKYTDRTTFKACRSWARGMRKKRKIIRAPPRGKSMRVQYEAFVDDTPAHLETMCEFLGMNYESSMLDYLNRELHILGGNPGPLTPYVDLHGLKYLYFAREGGTHEVMDFTASTYKHVKGKVMELDHYRKTDPKKFKDERWKEELTDGQLRLFALTAGRVNRKYGYPASLDRQSSIVST